jgi:hypothetical protein
LLIFCICLFFSGYSEIRQQWQSLIVLLFEMGFSKQKVSTILDVYVTSVKKQK